ncbi:hypothetical protein R4B61_07490 (plasmid) [Fructilactobacillus vespulae]|uniref:pLS20_p028 family conjugation system transmembrane protein n=1 Tax=Fructilactobacillus vespulae TaxID=1249630 RepID=UPI0039B3E137
MINFINNMTSVGIPNGNSPDQWVPFYHAWEKAGYLNFTGIWEIKVFGAIKDILLRLFYDIAVGMEDIFNASLKIFGIFDDFGSGPLHSLRMLIFWLGIAFLIVSLTGLALSQIFGKGEKYLKGIKSAVIFTFVVILLPFIVSSMGKINESGAKAIENNGNANSMAINFINGNIIDSTRLASKNFNFDPDDIQPDKDNLNNFKDESIHSVHFGDVVSESNLKSSKNKPGIKAFQHDLITGDNGNDTIEDYAMPKDNKTGITKIFLPGYARYTGHYWIALLSLMILAMFLIVMSIRVIRSSYQIIITTLSAPLVLYVNLQKPSRVKDMLSAISGTMIGIWAEIISVRVFMIVISSLDNNPAVKALNAGGLELGMMKLFILIGSMFGFLYGIQLIEKWTGVPNGTGHGMLGFALGGALAAKGISSLASAGFGVGNSALEKVKGTNSASTGSGNYAHQIGANSDPTKGVGKDGENKGTNDNADSNNEHKGNENPNQNNGTNGTSVDSGSLNNGDSPVDDEDGKGTNDTAIDAGAQDNGKSPVDGVDGKGTNDTAIDAGSQDNGKSPVNGVGDKGTNDTAINSGNQDNGKSPVDGVGDKGTNDTALNSGNRDNGKTPVEKEGSTPSSYGTTDDSISSDNTDGSETSGTSDSTYTDGGTSEGSNPANPTSDVDSKPTGGITNPELAKKIDSIGRHQQMSDQRQEQIAKSSKPSTFDKIQGVANTASRIRQETDEEGIGTPEDKDEF